MPAKNSFKREEHLKSRKLIAALFDSGKSVASPFFRVLWLRSNLPLQNIPVQICISVPSGKFSAAAIRNRIKRKISEAYRTNKHELIKIITTRHSLNPKMKSGLVLMIIYSSKVEMEFSEIEIALKEVFQKLIMDVAKSVNAA